MISAFILHTRGEPIPTLLFPLVVTQMQLIEGLRWIHVVDERILAILGKLTLGLQPAAALYAAGASQFILPYGVAQLGMEVLFGSRDLRFIVAPDGHFRWKWLEPSSLLAAVPYWTALVYASLRILPMGLNLLLMGIYVYYSAIHGRYNTEGSLWCVAVNILWIYYLFRRA